MKHSDQTYHGILHRESIPGMNRKQQMDPGRTRSIWKRSVPALAGFFLLSGCANFELPDWVPDLTGGEGKTAQHVSSRTIDAAPTPDPSREEVKAIQGDLAELGYNPGRIDGIAGTRTKEAIRA